MSLNGDIWSWISDTGEKVSIFNLIISQEILIRLVSSSWDYLSSTRAASSSSARVWQVDTSLFSSIKDVFFAWDLKGLLTIWRLKGHCEHATFTTSLSDGLHSITSTELFSKWFFWSGTTPLLLTENSGMNESEWAFIKILLALTLALHDRLLMLPWRVEVLPKFICFLPAIIGPKVRFEDGYAFIRTCENLAWIFEGLAALMMDVDFLIDDSMLTPPKTFLELI